MPLHSRARATRGLRGSSGDTVQRLVVVHDENVSPAARSPVEPAIDCRGLTKDYGGGRGVFDLTLTVESGEVMGFVGPNGAGKSTTIRLLMDLIRPDRGSATICGLDIRRDSLAIKRLFNLLLAVYGAIVGAKALRGAEERRAAEELLADGVSRRVLPLGRTAGFVLIAGLVSTGLAVGTALRHGRGRRAGPARLGHQLRDDRPGRSGRTLPG